MNKLAFIFARFFRAAVGAQRTNLGNEPLRNHPANRKANQT
jgi:hypothetical protein